MTIQIFFFTNPSITDLMILCEYSGICEMYGCDARDIQLSGVDRLIFDTYTGKRS